MWLLTVCILFIAISSVICNDTEEIVSIKNGKIKGRVLQTKCKKTFYSFQQIPFAEPPVGELRFEPPQEVRNWNGTLDCTKNTKICMQMSRDSDKETEDCLYINVYTPVKPGSNKKLPVLYYIYGGAFIFGSGIFDKIGPHYFMENDVVVVTVGYRLGVFGFISTLDTVLSGNNGLKDQHLGLKWVQENISKFGGDPKKVTIMGQSAGSASVTYILMNKATKGLYRAGIGQSGSCINSRSYQPQARKVAFDLGARLKFSGNTSEELKTFLRSKSAWEIKKASTEMSDSYTDHIFVPVVEVEHKGAFITERMFSAIKNGRFNKVPLLMGTTSEEMIKKLADGVDVFKNELKDLDKDLSLLVNNNMHISDPETKKKVGLEIRNIYSNESLTEHIDAAVKYFSDSMFSKATMRYAELHSKFADVYFYKFSYSGPLGRNNIVKIPGAGKVQHSEDNNYLWALNGNDSEILQYPENDRITSDLFVKICSDFTKNLAPTIRNLTWPKLQPGSFKYLDIDEKLEVKKDPRGDAYAKWIDVYDKWAVKPLVTF